MMLQEVKKEMSQFLRINSHPLIDNTVYTPEVINQDFDYLYDAFSKTYKWFNTLSYQRKIGLILLGCMGFKKLILNKKLMNAMENKNYHRAALHILASYRKILGMKAYQLAHIIDTGKL